MYRHQGVLIVSLVVCTSRSIECKSCGMYIKKYGLYAVQLTCKIYCHVLEFPVFVETKCDRKAGGEHTSQCPSQCCKL